MTVTMYMNPTAAINAMPVAADRFKSLVVVFGGGGGGGNGCDIEHET